MIVIAGANGQLGRDFQALFRRLKLDFIPTHHTAINGCTAMDITDSTAVERFFEHVPNVTYMINCAAYNQVDRAEEEKDKALALNKEAAANLAKIAKQLNAVYVTFSTDFVFDGVKRQPYTETDTPNPLSVYGESKLKGEQAVLDTYEKIFVIRTSWVFGLGNHNFNKTVLGWAASRNELQVVDDQISVPTYTKDLAEYAWALVQSGQYGLYHLTNGGEASKYDQAKYVLNRIGWQGEIRPAKTADFPLPAARPPYSKLNSTKAERIIGKTMPPWQDAIDRFLQEMKEAGELT